MLSTRILCLTSVLFMFLEMFAPVQAAEIAWRSDFRQALAESRKLNKPMLVKITAPWCGHCKRMLVTTYADPKIIEQVSDCFIPVKINADKEKQLVDAIEVEGLPTTVVISPQLDIVHRITGYQSAAQLERHLSHVCPVKHEQTQPETQLVSTAQAKVPADSFAFNQFCLVSLIEERTLQEGSDKYTVNFRGQTLSFATAEFKQQYLAHPEKYWPSLDGNCPVNAHDRKQRVTGDPEYAVIFQGKLWFCASQADREKFAQTPTIYAKTK